MATIFCVEDDESIRELVLYALRGGGFEAQGFESGEAFFETLQQMRPDLLLLDIMLPGEDGLSLLRRLRAGDYQTLPVVLLTARGTEYDKVRGLDLGADDYVSKPFGVMELLSRIRSVLRRCADTHTDALLKRGGIVLNPDSRVVTVGNTACALTFKEFELLQYLMQNPGVALSRDKMLAAVWGFNFEGESRTVDMHIKTLRQKLIQAGSRDVIHTVRSVGYKFEDAQP